MQNVVRKNKYIIYNEDKKVLAFELLTEKGKIRTVLPGSIIGYEGFSNLYIEVIELLLNDKDDLVFLTQTNRDNSTFNCENGKLKKQDSCVLCDYYSYYKEFTKEDYENIMNLCYEYGFMPRFYTIEELLELIKKRNKRNCFIREDMKEPMEELQKRLKFIKY